ncbi:YheC/YheD family endospore coat-associated protein [Virgibacillus senegalensis]|uniref:YheC/YheD family endospore coat-associated protein n=1 Tax=Virgibacillus senegalensis TaxID=1499679 RepID=UPI00069D5CEA|nr:YheC/YheD family protein [Virgibacillus senegalensis]
METFKIKFYQGSQNRMIIPYRHLEIFEPVTEIQYGPIHSPVETLFHDKDPMTLYISSHLKNLLNLHKSSSLSINIQNERCTILLTIGILTAGFSGNHFLTDERAPIFSRMSMAGKRMGMQALFFGHQHIDYENKQLQAFYYENGSWQKGLFPLPKVVYNRIPNRKTEHHPDVMKAKSSIEERAILFNNDFFNKWEIYQCLMKDPTCSFLVPETILHPSEQKIETMLKKYNVYIKPIHGSRGNGIVKCLLLSDGVLECHYYLDNKPQVNRYENPQAFFQQHFPNGMKGYIAQQEVKLIQKRNSPLDFRVHVNKNHRNSWEVPLMCAKFAGKGSLTTHVKRGGKVLLIEELFKGEEADKIKKRLEAMALLVVESIEKNYPATIGEIGIDFGIDREGRIWLFEVNSKPGFSVFQHPKLAEQAETVLSYPFQYAFYLSNLQDRVT